MKTFVFIGIIVSSIVILLIITNPSLETHHQRIYLTTQTQLTLESDFLQKNFLEKKNLLNLLKLQLVNILSKEIILTSFIRTMLLKSTYRDYKFFSVLILKNTQGKNVFVSFGIFKQVFVNERWYRADSDTELTRFLTRLTPLSAAVIMILLAMSVATWYIILTKTVHLSVIRWQTHRFIQFFWQTPTLDSVKTWLEKKMWTTPGPHLAWHGLHASLRHRQQAQLDTLCSHSEFLTRALRHSLTKDRVQLEAGLTFLATVGSSAPFIGLFGTVMSIHTALLSMKVQGAVSVGSLAGPVGEALIMTAFGLAVAIPAVLAYNFFVRSQRKLFNSLEEFAYELYNHLSLCNSNVSS